MRIMVYGLIVGAVIFAGQTFQTKAIELAYRSTYLLHVMSPIFGNGEANGTIFFVDDTMLVTAGHNFTSGARYFIDHEHSIEVVMIDRAVDHDVMIMQLTGEYKHSSVSLSNRVPSIGEALTLVGFPLGLETELALPVTKIGKEMSGDDCKVPLAGTAVRGMSGSPVIDKRGNVVGIMVSGWDILGHSFPIMEPIEHILHLLQEHR